MQVQAQIEGYWKGQIDLGVQKLEMAFNIKAAENGFYATLDVPAQGAFDIPVDEMTFQEGQLQLTMKAMGASYSGTLKDAAIEGTFTQHGMTFPLILAKAENLTIAFNKLKSQQPAVAEETAEDNSKEEATAEKKEKPTLNSLCEEYGIYGMLAQYEKLLKKGDKRAAKNVEDRMWEIEKKVKADQSLPESLRKRFVEYIETREDQIEDKY